MRRTTRVERALLAQEVRAEHGVVDRQVVAAADQAGAAGPVEVDDVGRVQRAERGREREQVARADGEPLAPQGLAEPREHAEQRALPGVRHW